MPSSSRCAWRAAAFFICIRLLKWYYESVDYISHSSNAPVTIENLTSLSFSDRLSRIGYLLKHTFTVLGRDTDIVRPWLWMIVYAAVMVTAFFGGIILFFLGDGMMGAATLGLAVLMFIYKYFFYNYKEVAQSWLVYETICGRDRSYGEAKTAARERKSGVRKLAGLDMLMAYLMSQRGSGDNQGLGAKLVNLVLSGLSEVWDLVNHYMLPAIAIDQLTLTEGVKKMKSLRNQVPETLTGVFGIDFIGRIVVQVTGSLYLLLVLASAGGMYLGGEALPEAFTFTFEENPIGSGPLLLNVLPLLVGLYVAKLFGVVFERVITSIKVMYFTIFYTQITHRDRIAEDLQPQLVSYLRMEEDGAEVAAPAAEEAMASTE